MGIKVLWGLTAAGHSMDRFTVTKDWTFDSQYKNTWAPSEQALQPRTRPSARLSRSFSVVNMNVTLTLASKRYPHIGSKRSTRSRLKNVRSKDQLPPRESSWLLGSRKFSMGSIPQCRVSRLPLGRNLASQPWLSISNLNTGLRIFSLEHPYFTHSL